MTVFAKLVTDVIVESPSWSAEPDAEAIVSRAIAAAADIAPARAGDAEVAVALIDDGAIRALNQAWRGIDKPTNVLSFPAPPLPAPDTPRPLGDIAIAYETTQREAIAEHKAFAAHLSHLAIHGYLHLIGYDHGRDDEADAMEQLERTILATLGIDDPYRAAS